MIRNINIRQLSHKLSVAKEPSFGELSRSGKKILKTQITQVYMQDDPDGYDKEEIDLTPRKNFYYFKYEIPNNARKGSLGIRKALELFHEMKSRNKLTPEYTHFSSLIYGCAKAGYTKKAFELYEESTKYIGNPSKSMVTSLINACAESPYREYGLEKLEWLRNHLIVDVNHQLNLIQYNCLIKAYAKLNDLNGVASVVQSMIEERIYPKTDTFNMILSACISHKEAGATLALRVFKRMKLYELKPDLNTYKLLIRAIRDCKLGSTDLLKRTFAELPAMTTIEQRFKYNQVRKKSSKENNFEWMPRITELKDCIITGLDLKESENRLDIKNSNSIDQTIVQEPASISLHNQTKDTKPEKTQLQISTPRIEDITYHLKSAEDPPNLLSDDHLTLFCQVESINMDLVNKQFNKLMLFGGMSGFLKAMEKDGLQPDAKTFSLILGCICPDHESIKEYLYLSEKYKIKRDLIFYDHLVGHICHNYRDMDRLNLALNIVDEMQKEIRPNISTFEMLAYGCNSMVEAKNLIDDLEKSGFVITEKLINGFFQYAMVKFDFYYLNQLVILCKSRKLQPSKNLVDSLELVKSKFRMHVSQKTDKASSSTKNLDRFSENLARWTRSAGLASQEHAWDQFHVEDKSKREGFIDFVKKFKALDQAKQEAMKKGGKLGNLMEKAEEILSNDKVKDNQIDGEAFEEIDEL